MGACGGGGILTHICSETRIADRTLLSAGYREISHCEVAMMIQGYSDFCNVADLVRPVGICHSDVYFRVVPAISAASKSSDVSE